MGKTISLLEEIKKGGYESSLFVTFNAYLPFYEDVVLRKLVSAGSRHNVLIMDQKQFALSVANDPPQFAGRHYSLVPMHSNGAFHPKVIMLLGKRKGTLFLGSHNLTLSGFGFNREITNLISFQDKDDVEAVNVIRHVWMKIETWILWQGDRLPKHLVEMVDKIASFAPWLKKEVAFKSENFSVIGSDPESPSLWQQLRDRIEGKAKRIIISGAFFDNDMNFIKEVQTQLNPHEFFVGIEPSTVQIPNKAMKLKGINFMDSSYIAAKDKDEKSQLGYLHAKSLLVETKEGTFYLASGSANPSSAAWLSDGMSGNTEMMLVRVGKEAEIAAREIGLLDIPEMPRLTATDWNLTRESWRAQKTDNMEPSFGMGIALSTDKYITFKVHLPDLPGILDCKILDHNKALQVSVKGSLIDGEYCINLLDLDKLDAFYIKFSLRKKEFLFFVHDKEQIKQHSRTGLQRRFREALNSLNAETPDIVTLIHCVDKIIFSKTEDARATASKLRAGKKGTEKDDSGSEEGLGMSIDIGETRKSKKKARIRVSDDLAYLLDTLIYHLKLDKEVERPLESLDGKGRSEEEQVGAEDDEDSGKENTHGETAANTLKLCHGKIHTLVGRMVNHLDEYKKSKISLEDVVVRLTGVLALLRHLRGCDGKVFWIKPGQTSFLHKERKKLLDAVAGSLFEGKASLLCSCNKADELSTSEDMAKLRGLLLWLGWDCGLKLNLEEPFNESHEEWSSRIKNNALLLALTQLVKEDEVTIHEAEQSIAPLCASDMDWFEWILSTGKKISKFIASPREFSMQSSIKPGDLAFHPKVLSMGVRTVLSQVSSKTTLVSFDPNKKYIAYLTDAIRIAPFEKVIHIKESLG